MKWLLTGTEAESQRAAEILHSLVRFKNVWLITITIKS